MAALSASLASQALSLSAGASLARATGSRGAASLSPLRIAGLNAAARTSSAGRAGVVVRASVAVEPPSADPAALNQQFGGAGVAVDSGLGGLTRVVLTSQDGSVAEVYLYGACTTSWKLPSGEDLLFVRPDAVFTGQKPISGGIPHCFPQFGPGAMQQHGFARNLSWELVASEPGPAPSITLRLGESEYTRAMWDFSFEALFKISLSAGELSTSFSVTNLDSKPFEFTTALHSYFRAAIEGVKVSGLKGLQFLNKDPDPTNPIPGTEAREEVTFPGFVDCMYLDAPATLVLENGVGQRLAINNEGWKDAVVWSPHLTMEACYKDFVCVENAQLSPVKLEPGTSWRAVQKLVPQ